VANHLKAVKRLQIRHLLVQGNSIRSTARLTGSQIRTILSHLVSAEEHCRELMDTLWSLDELMERRSVL
jgi:transposase-like protein